MAVKPGSCGRSTSISRLPLEERSADAPPSLRARVISRRRRAALALTKDRAEIETHHDEGGSTHEEARRQRDESGGVEKRLRLIHIGRAQQYARTQSPLIQASEYRLESEVNIRQPSTGSPRPEGRSCWLRSRGHGARRSMPLAPQAMASSLYSRPRWVFRPSSRLVSCPHYRTRRRRPMRFGRSHVHDGVRDPARRHRTRRSRKAASSRSGSLSTGPGGGDLPRLMR